jgi:hypothetical protein
MRAVCGLSQGTGVEQANFFHATHREGNAEAPTNKANTWNPFTARSAQESKSASFVIRQTIDAVEEAELPAGWSKEAKANFRWTEDTHAFAISTEDGKHNQGKVLCFRCKDAEEKAWMIALLLREAEQARAAFIKQHRWADARAAVLRFLETSPVQMLMTFLIVAAFGLTVLEAQLRPAEDSDTYNVLATVELALTIAFVIELIANLFAHWLWAFFSNGWLVFDFVIVSLR